MERVEISYGSETAPMEWDGAQASSPIYVDGNCTPYQTASARHRTDLAVALVCHYVWPEVEWPEVPATGSISEIAPTAAWDEMSYRAVDEEPVAP